MPTDTLTLPLWAVGLFSALGLGLFGVVSFFLVRTLDGVSKASDKLSDAIEGLKEVVSHHHTEIELLKATKVDR